MQNDCSIEQNGCFIEAMPYAIIYPFKAVSSLLENISQNMYVLILETCISQIYPLYNNQDHCGLSRVIQCQHNQIQKLTNIAIYIRMANPSYFSNQAFSQIDS